MKVGSRKSSKWYSSSCPGFIHKKKISIISFRTFMTDLKCSCYNIGWQQCCFKCIHLWYASPWKFIRAKPQSCHYEPSFNILPEMIIHCSSHAEPEFVHFLGQMFSWVSFPFSGNWCSTSVSCYRVWQRGQWYCSSDLLVNVMNV